MHFHLRQEAVEQEEMLWEDHTYRIHKQEVVLYPIMDLSYVSMA